VRKMINELSVGAEAKPTPAQGQWLLASKEWVKAKAADTIIRTLAHLHAGIPA